MMWWSVNCGSQIVILVAENLVFSSRTKHICGKESFAVLMHKDKSLVLCFASSSVASSSVRADRNIVVPELIKKVGGSVIQLIPLTLKFNTVYFEDQVQAGEWDEVERYLFGFTKIDDNNWSLKMFFEIRKQKYLEALDRQVVYSIFMNDREKAVDILVNDLKVFSAYNENMYKEMTQLITLDDIRQHDQLSDYLDSKSARKIMLLELKRLIKGNPLFKEKHDYT
ncbi:hypothetical protein L6452_32029 [Arctium lappa]|uniref:Uncharacterized protein n=1 Tax=Arctium lappa TaxID=4217 RepID=A0ACB8Z3P7_ARCLA|nr:hypothetical protein L6452_32029 [Arctium lappa]